MKNRTLNLATLVAILSLAILVMAGCGNNDKPSAPAEKVVNVDSLPLLFEKGRDTLIASCTAVDFKWKDCEGGFHPSKKFVPSYGSPVTLQGEKADLGHMIGLSDGQYLVIRDGRDERARLKNSLSPTVTKSEQNSVEPIKKTEEDFFPPLFWDILKFFLGAFVLLAIMYILWEILRRLYYGLSGPLARRDMGGNQYTTPPATTPPAGKGPSTDSPSQPSVTNITNHYEATARSGPQMAISFQGEGEDAMSFEVVGQFSLPLQVKVTKGKEDPTVVDFGRPTSHSESSGEDRNRQER